MNLRVGGLVFLPRLRPPGVDVGEDIVAGYLKTSAQEVKQKRHFLKLDGFQPPAK